MCHNQFLELNKFVKILDKRISKPKTNTITKVRMSPSFSVAPVTSPAWAITVPNASHQDTVAQLVIKNHSFAQE